MVEYNAVEELAAFAGLDAEVGGILTDEDVAYAASSLEPNSSAALLVWEDTWAAPFAAAVRNANGVILEAHESRARSSNSQSAPWPTPSTEIGKSTPWAPDACRRR